MSLSNRLEFTQDEKEIFCSLNLKNSPSFQKEKISIAGELAQAYLLGTKDTVCDPERAAKYENIANGIEEIKKPPFFSIENFRSLISTGSFYTITGWFTSIRLFLSRVNKITSILGRSFLPSLFSIGGLSYGVTLAFDLGIIAGSLIATVYHHVKDPSPSKLPLGKKLWQTLKKVVLDEGRLSNMLNDAVWFSINLTAFILTGGIISILNVAGFVFDMKHEIAKWFVEYKKYDNLTQKVINEINQEQININKLTNDVINLSTYIKKLENKRDKSDDPEEKRNYARSIASLKREVEEKKNKIILKKAGINELNDVKIQLEEKTKEIIQNRLRIAIGVTLAFVGILLILYPPVGVPVITAALIGSSLALVGGSIMTGLGKRLYDVGKTYGGMLFNFIKSKVMAPPEKKLDLPPDIDHIKQPRLKTNSYTAHFKPLLPKEAPKLQPVAVSPSIPIPKPGEKLQTGHPKIDPFTSTPDVVSLFPESQSLSVKVF